MVKTILQIKYNKTNDQKIIFVPKKSNLQVGMYVELIEVQIEYDRH